MINRVSVRKIPNGYHAPLGRYWAEVDGRPVHDDGRMYFATRDDAKRAAIKSLSVFIKRESL